MYFLNLLVLFNTVVNLFLLKDGKRKTSGKDYRYENNTDLDLYLLQNIKYNEIRKHIVEILLDDNVDDFSKMNIIENMDPKILNYVTYYNNNLTAGDLYKDFHFNFDE